jgi:hypothetical protein
VSRCTHAIVQNRPFRSWRHIESFSHARIEAGDRRRTAAVRIV